MIDPSMVPEVSAALETMDESTPPTDRDAKEKFLALIGLKFGDRLVHVGEPKRKIYTLVDLYIVGWVVLTVKSDTGFNRYPVYAMAPARADCFAGQEQRDQAESLLQHEERGCGF